MIVSLLVTPVWGSVFNVGKSPNITSLQYRRVGCAHSLVKGYYLFSDTAVYRRKSKRELQSDLEYVHIPQKNIEHQINTGVYTSILDTGPDFASQYLPLVPPWPRSLCPSHPGFGFSITDLQNLACPMFLVRTLSLDFSSPYRIWMGVMGTIIGWGKVPMPGTIIIAQSVHTQFESAFPPGKPSLRLPSHMPLDNNSDLAMLGVFFTPLELL